jgi:hypothetical protein
MSFREICPGNYIVAISPSDGHFFKTFFAAFAESFLSSSQMSPTANPAKSMPDSRARGRTQPAVPQYLDCDDLSWRPSNNIPPPRPGLPGPKGPRRHALDSERGRLSSLTVPKPEGRSSVGGAAPGPVLQPVSSTTHDPTPSFRDYRIVTPDDPNSPINIHDIDGGFTNTTLGGPLPSSFSSLDLDDIETIAEYLKINDQNGSVGIPESVRPHTPLASPHWTTWGKEKVASCSCSCGHGLRPYARG